MKILTHEKKKTLFFLFEMDFSHFLLSEGGDEIQIRSN